jgi:hypothetical protein
MITYLLLRTNSRLQAQTNVSVAARLAASMGPARG